MSDIDEKVSREVMQRDMDDIAELRKSTPFNRYFVRRLKQKLEAMNETLRHAKPEKCDKEEREIVRRIMLEYEHLLGMMDAEENICHQQLSLAPQSSRQGQAPVSSAS